MTQQWTPEDEAAAERRDARRAKTKELQTRLVATLVARTLREAGYEVAELGDGVYIVSSVEDALVSASVVVTTKG